MVGTEYVIIKTRVSVFDVRKPEVIQELKCSVTNIQSYNTIILLKFDELHIGFNERLHLYKINEDKTTELIKTK